MSGTGLAPICVCFSSINLFNLGISITPPIQSRLIQRAVIPKTHGTGASKGFSGSTEHQSTSNPMYDLSSRSDVHSLWKTGDQTFLTLEDDALHLLTRLLFLDGTKIYLTRKYTSIVTMGCSRQHRTDTKHYGERRQPSPDSCGFGTVAKRTSRII